MVLAGGVGLALVGFGADVAPFGSVVGWWKFDDAANPGKDSSEYGNDLDGLSNVSAGVIDSGYTTRGTYNDSGCLYIGTAGNTATATPKKIWDTTKGFTYAMRSRTADGKVDTTIDANVNGVLNALNDHKGWHFIAYRYDPDKLTGNNNWLRWLFADLTDPNDGNRAEVTSDDTIYFPLSTDIAIGGNVGAKGKIYGFTYDKKLPFKGYMDDVIVVSRTMTKTEIQRLYLTGDPNPYLVSDNDVAFASASGWSCSEKSLAYSPTDLPGADFVVDDGRTIKAPAAHAGTTFGGHSLILGRRSPLTSKVDGTTQIAGTIGNFVQQASVTIPDLRLNNGKLTASAGTTLAATKLTVNATEGNPYEVNVASGTYAVTGAASGDGWLKKTGAGTLDLTGLTGAAKVVVTEGKVLAGPNVTVTYDLEEDRGAVPVLMAE